MSEFAGKVVLVTGGTKGVGRAVSLEFARRGAHVIVNWFHDRAAALDTVAQIVAAGGTAEEVRASVAKPDDPAAMFQRVAGRHGRLDVLVNSAARGTFVPSARLTERDWQKSFELNVHGPRRCARAALPLLSGTRGTVVNVSSIGARLTIDNYSVVGVAKAAVEALTRYLAAEFAPYGVRVNAASAGMLDTSTIALFPDSDRLCSAITAATPLGRLGTGEELARLVVFLASAESGWITGQTVLADGGLSLGHAMLRAERGSAVSKQGQEGRAGSGEASVAIVGTGLAVPGADSPDAFWTLLRRGNPVFSEPPADRFDIDRFWSAAPKAEDRTYSRLAGYVTLGTGSDTPGAGGDLSVRWLGHAIRQALTGVHRRADDRVGCYMGACTDGNLYFERAMVSEYAARRLNACWPGGAGPGTGRLREVLRGHFHLDSAPATHLPDGVVRSAIDGLLPDGSSHAVVDTACSSSLYAVDMGVKNLLDHKCDLAVCGGVWMFTPRYSVTFASLGGLSRQGDVRPYDRNADGTLFSDGAAALVLKRLADARRDGDQVLGVLAGFGAAADGHGKSIYAPAERGQRLAIERAYVAARLTRDEVGWVIGHGTGTAAGDATELRVLREQATSGEVLCTSNKSLVGHTGWSAGAVSLIHATLGLRHRLVPAQHRYAESAEPTAPVRIPLRGTPVPDGPRRAVAVSGFGFGGTNAHQIVAPASAAPPRSQPPAKDGRWAVLAWSAHLPGNPPTRAVAARIAQGRPPSDAPTFGSRYPALPAHLLRLPADTLAATDRTHLMAVAVAERFASEHGPLWRGHEETTGVLAAHIGPTTAYGEVALRCYADELSTVRMAEDQAGFDAAVAAWRTRVKTETRPVSKDTQPGLMGNIIPARIAAHLDLNGPVLLIDAGPASTGTAIATACQYLSVGQLDLALVLAVHGNSTAELAALLHLDGAPAEGAFLIALAREDYARTAGWPVLCALDGHDLRTLCSQPPGRQSGARWYGAANEAIDFLAAVERRAAGSPAAGEKDQPPPIAIRYATSWTQAPALPDVSVHPGGDDWLLLADAASAHAVPDRVRAVAGLVVVTGEIPADLHTRRFRQLRVLGALPGRQHWPAPPDPALLALHEALFLAAQASRDRLESVGVLLSDPLPHGVPHPHAGLFTGLVNSLAWDLDRCRFACTITDRPATDWWELLETELAGYDGSPVTLHRGRTRLRRRLYASPPACATEIPALDDGAVVVATGGARGITAACVEALAVRAAIRVWLLGSSPLGGVPAALLEAADSDLGRLRAEYIAQARRTSGQRSVAELNAGFNQMLRARETTLTLSRLRDRCGEAAVHYLTCDVTDASSVARAAAEIGPVDLLIHGAGLHRGGDISRIRLQTMRAVRDVKMLGYHNLKQAFRDPPPRRWCNFGSVAGLVGLPGETDYAPANDVLAAAAEYESTVRGADEYTIAWTIWSGVGMGSPAEIQQANARSGRMSPLVPQVGVSHFLAELPRRAAAEPHVSFLSTAETTSFGRQHRGLVSAQRPLRAGLFLGNPHTRLDRQASWTLHLDPRIASYLNDHLVAGRVTVPGAVLAAIAAEAAVHLAPGTVPHALRCLRFRSFVRPPGHGQAPHQIIARLLETGSPNVSVRVQITSDVLSRDGRVLRGDREHFQATVVLGPPGTRPAHARRTAPPAGEPADDPYYREDSAVRLSGVFRAAREWRVGPRGAAARWLPDLRSRPDARDLLDRSLIPVTLLDALARTRALYAADGRAYVPRAFDTIDLHPSATNDASLVHSHPAGLEVVYDPSDETAVALAADGAVLVRLTGLDLVALAGTSS
jgi:NAD(P)-dependent dehydrogenase (short-subunit alcohol dehydrogenase family)/3-oxoacyl-(acyl-carrier-protein) synthase